METADCQFPLAVELQEVTEVPWSWASPKRGSSTIVTTSTLVGCLLLFVTGTPCCSRGGAPGESCLRRIPVLYRGIICGLSESGGPSPHHPFLSGAGVGQPFPPETDRDSQLIFQDAWEQVGLYWLPGQQPDEDLE